MIIGFILSLPAYLIGMIIGLLPSGASMPTEWIESVYAIWRYIEAFAFIVPVSTLLTVLGLALTFHMAIFGFKIFHWIITKIPTIG